MTPRFYRVNLSSERALIETGERQHQEFKLYLFFFFLTDGSNIGECVLNVRQQ